MKSFKNFYIRNNNLTQLQNTSFESPSITTNSYLYYNSFTQTQKDNFKWTGLFSTEMRKLTNTITDIAGKIDIIREGGNLLY